MTRSVRNIKIFIGLLVFLIPILCIIAFIVIPNSRKITSIELENTEISLYKGENSIINYNIVPSNATDANIVFSVSDDSVISISNNEIFAIRKGSSKVCLMQKGNESIKSCVVVNVKSKRDDFIKELDNSIFCTKKENLVYKCGDEILDINQKLYYLDVKSDDMHMYYEYHYAQDYIKGYATIGNIKIEHYYDTNTGILSCVGNSAVAQEYSCGYSQQQTTINLLNTLIKSFDQILELSGGYSKEDIIYE